MREDNQAEREERIRLWRERGTPSGGGPGDLRGWEMHHAETARLSPLGERLLGLRSWRDPQGGA